MLLLNTNLLKIQNILLFNFYLIFNKIKYLIKGFGDKHYIERRSELNKLANSYRYGEPIPLVEYTKEEHVNKY